MSLVWKFPGGYESLDVGDAGVVISGSGKVMLISETSSIKWSVEGNFHLAKIWEGCVMAAEGEEILCLAVEDGSEIWKKKLDGKVSEIELGEKAYVGTESGTVYAFNRAGKVLWEYRIGKKVKGIKVRGKVYVLTDEELLCLSEESPKPFMSFQPPEQESPEELSGEGEWIPGMDGIYG